MVKKGEQGKHRYKDMVKSQGTNTCIHTHTCTCTHARMYTPGQVNTSSTHARKIMRLRTTIAARYGKQTNAALLLICITYAWILSHVQ